MHSFSAMTKVQKKKKNTSPRTAPAMSCSRLISKLISVSILIGNPPNGSVSHLVKLVYLRRETSDRHLSWSSSPSLTVL